uniref:Beta-catenin-like protein 1 n=1 Tax=Syphacia muris TaxID=451379 RepID=A0A0N5ASZ8_9BILA
MATIDVKEILQASSEPAVKRPRVSEETNNVVKESSDISDILAALEQDDSQNTIVDEMAVKRVVLQLEKKTLKNRELRIKYSDEPAKFMDSEIDLNQAIQEMHMVATQPDLYGVLVDLGAVTTLLQLMGHENPDIIAATANLLQELTDVDTVNEEGEGAIRLYDALIQGQLVETIVQQSIERLDENVRDEADAIHNALSVVESVLDLRGDYADVCVEQGLFNWLLRRATQRGTLDANKMYASELLALLLQTSELGQKKLTEKIDGFDLLLRALAFYKRHDPGSRDEREHMENLFDSVCAALMYAPNRQKFIDGEGLQLMNLMLREKKESRESALKVLDYATSGPEGKANCNKCIEIYALRTIFPLFMRTPARVKRKDSSPNEHEEHVCSILSSLLSSCNEDGRSRIFSKFVEHECEKVDRAVELVLKYQERIKRYDSKRDVKSSLTDEELDQLYIDRLDAGLYTLQRIVLVLADVCANGSSVCRARAMKLFQMRTGNNKFSRHLIPVLEEYEINLGAEAEEERKRTRLLIARLSSLEKSAS